jgi:predicted metalloprotease with PDZ domain
VECFARPTTTSSWIRRRATFGRRGLDDVFRRLFRSYAAKGRGYPPGAVEDAAVRVAGSRPAVRVFFDRYVRGTGTPDLARLLKVAGLRLREVPEAEEGVTDTMRPRVHAHFGWKAKAENGRLVVAEVLAGEPAQQGGVNAGDVLVAVDGFRASESAGSGRASALEEACLRRRGRRAGSRA